MRNLVIDGIATPINSSYTLNQSYDPLQGVERGRFMNGTGFQQTAWTGKLSTTISGTGVMPSGLVGIDYTATVTIKGIAERCINSNSNVISVPANRRADYGVEGKALVDGIWQSTPVSMAGDTATLTTVAGAALYQAIYWPELICYLDPPQENRSARSSEYSWSITAFEV